MLTRSLGKEQEALKKWGTGEWKGFAEKPRKPTEEEIRTLAYGTKRPVFAEKYGIPKMEQEIEKATQAYEKRGAGGYDFLENIRRGVEEREPSFKMKRPELEAKYGNVKSKSYIENPFTRQALIEREQAGGRTSMATLLEKAGKLYEAELTREKTGIEQKQRAFERALANYKEEYEQASGMDVAEATEAQKQRERKEKLEDYLAQLQMKEAVSGGGGGGGKRGGGGGGGYSSGGGYGTEGGLSESDLNALEEKVKNREISREEYGKILADATGENLDTIMADIYSNIPDSALKGIDVGGQILSPEQAEKYKKVQEAGYKGGYLGSLGSIGQSFKEAAKTGYGKFKSYLGRRY